MTDIDKLYNRVQTEAYLDADLAPPDLRAPIIASPPTPYTDQKMMSTSTTCMLADENTNYKICSNGALWIETRNRIRYQNLATKMNCENPTIFLKILKI
jgi:hypothetical protein